MKPSVISVIVREVGLRDGLQSISRVLPTAIALCTKVARWLEGETLHGSLWRAGPSKTMLATV